MKKIIVFTLLLLFTGCGHNTQTTSGKSYLEKYQGVPTVSVASDDNINIEEKIRKVASVEPVLKFPARIGLAKIEHGHLSTVSGEEIEAWIKVRNNLGKGFGEFVPVNPMIAKMVTSDIDTDVVNEIRLGAARQHLDAVLIYESYSKSDSEMNFLSIADLTIIGGYILPSRALEVEGFANAMLIDVVQGYPHGTAEATVDKKAMATTWGSDDSKRELGEKVRTQAIIELTKEVEEMFKKLRWELAEKREKKK